MMQISVETCKYEPVSLLIERGQYYCNLVTIVDSIDYSNILPSIHIDKLSPCMYMRFNEDSKI